MSVILGITSVVIVVGYFVVTNLIESRLSNIINANPDRSYDLTYESLDLSILRTQVVIEGLKITPLNTDIASNRISGEVKSMRLNGFGVFPFLFSRSVLIDELKFVEPEFTLLNQTRKESTKGSKSFQRLFQDIISRGEIKNFSLERGRARVYLQTDSLRKIGQFDDLNIEVKGLSTDLIRLNYAIPFEFETIKTSLDNFEFELNLDQKLSVGSLDWDSEENRLEIQDAGLNYTRDWKSVARDKEFQTDLIEFNVEKLGISGLDPISSFYDSIVFASDKMEIENLVLKDGRDKNIPRPPDTPKQNFIQLLTQQELKLRIDTIHLMNSEIQYSEIVPGSTQPGVLTISEIDATWLNTNTFESDAQKNPITLELSAILNGAAEVRIEMEEDYSTFEVDGRVSVGPMDMTKLNPTLVHLVGVQVNSGNLYGINIDISYDSLGSYNVFAMEYDSLNIDILSKKRGGANKVLSTLGKAGYRKSHTRTEKKYEVHEYYTERNPYRGPINLLWVSIKDGLVQTVPSSTAGIFVKKPRQTKKKDKKKRKGKLWPFGG